jgi:hypothetical protein
MFKKLRIINIVVLSTLLLILQAGSLPAEYTANYYPAADLSFQYANSKLWGYLRLGLNYLESPRPLLLPETIPTTYVHPDLKGFGSYGFSQDAYTDVRKAYPFFKSYEWEDILHSQQLKESTKLHSSKC